LFTTGSAGGIALQSLARPNAELNLNAAHLSTIQYTRDFLAMASYLFIDGGHLRRHYTDAMQKWSGTDGDLAISSLNMNLGVEKCFWYDCVDDIQKAGESKFDLDNRIRTQEEWFNKVQRTFGTHVRLGSMTGSRKNKRQKQVDILLAVDAMNHAARRNMEQADLITGDQDFKPLVESLVNMGLLVRVLGDRQHTSQDLADAADNYQALTLQVYSRWSSQKFQQTFPIPSVAMGDWDHGNQNIVRVGTIGGQQARMYRVDSTFIAKIPAGDSFLSASFFDHARLLLSCDLECGPIEWEPE
jgi:uncharacterized LabA/DUF88 family protein